MVLIFAYVFRERESPRATSDLTVDTHRVLKFIRISTQFGRVREVEEGELKTSGASDLIKDVAIAVKCLRAAFCSSG